MRSTNATPTLKWPYSFRPSSEIYIAILSMRIEHVKKFHMHRFKPNPNYIYLLFRESRRDECINGIKTEAVFDKCIIWNKDNQNVYLFYRQFAENIKPVGGCGSGLSVTLTSKKWESSNTLSGWIPLIFKPFMIVRSTLQPEEGCCRWPSIGLDCFSYSCLEQLKGIS